MTTHKTERILNLTICLLVADRYLTKDRIREAVEAVASGRLDPSPLYTHRYKLDELAQALDATRDRPMGFLKAIIEP